MHPRSCAPSLSAKRVAVSSGCITSARPWVCQTPKSRPFAKDLQLTQNVNCFRLKGSQSLSRKCDQSAGAVPLFLQGEADDAKKARTQRLGNHKSQNRS